VRNAIRFGAALAAITLGLALGATALLLTGTPARAAAAGGGVSVSQAAEVWAWGLAAAAASTALSALAAGFAVAKVGTAAIGALAEKPELFGRLLIFVGLAEGIAIYGLIVSILILNRLT
jgi:V/A-type H+/Na+-transporting ATPase subunit K